MADEGEGAFGVGGGGNDRWINDDFWFGLLLEASPLSYGWIFCGINESSETEQFVLRNLLFN